MLADLFRRRLTQAVGISRLDNSPESALAAEVIAMAFEDALGPKEHMGDCARSRNAVVYDARKFFHDGRVAIWAGAAGIPVEDVLEFRKQVRSRRAKVLVAKHRQTSSWGRKLAKREKLAA